MKAVFVARAELWAFPVSTRARQGLTSAPIGRRAASARPPPATAAAMTCDTSSSVCTGRRVSPPQRICWRLIWDTHAAVEDGYGVTSVAEVSCTALRQHDMADANDAWPHAYCAAVFTFVFRAG